MKPSARRRVERQLHTMLGENCSLCGKPLGHNKKIFGGVTAAGVPALAGECCEGRIIEMLLSGIYVTHGYDNIGKGTRDTAPRLSQQQLADAVNNMQSHVAKVDALGAQIARQGGVRVDRMLPVNLKDTDWKIDDAKWFKLNSSRSHRLRAMYQGEEDTLFGPSAEKPLIPPAHKFQVLVRQIEPGKRLRIPFARNIETPIPDIEPVIHALFDAVAPESSRAGVITKNEIAKLALKYASAADQTRR